MAANGPESIKTLRSKYKSTFILMDGYDYPNANAKNCSFAFDRLGYGAAACASTSITAAWQTNPVEARNFVDMAASQLNPVFVAHITKNNAVMNQRNALLKSIMQGNSDSSILEIWDKQAAHEGALISYMRDSYIKKLNQVCGELYYAISGGKEKLELEYKSNVFKAEDFELPCDEAAFEKYFNKLRESEEYDIRTGITHSGVNRDEINIKINGISAKEYGSQGQIKSAALVIKLAQAEIFTKRSKDAPVVFLDDVMGELDENRQRFVFDIIRNMQVFITTPNERTLLPDIKGKILRISGGRIAEELR
jgi:DNA replication and repair protein RecF